MGFAGLEKLRSVITGVILAGGSGTRLRPILSDRPKVLAPVGGRPFLFYLLDQLSEGGIRKVVLCTGYLAEQVKSVVGGRYRDLEILYSQEDRPLGTAGALGRALPLLDSDPILVFNGDSYCDLDLPPFLKWHTQKNALGSLALVRHEDAARFGCVNFDSSGSILRFGEKEATGSGWINAGIYLLSQRLLRAIPRGREASMEYEIFPNFVRKGLFGFPEGRRFIDIGTPASYAEAETALIGGKTSFERHPSEHSPSISVDRASAGRRRYVLLDRDGTINIERHYLSDPEQFELLPGALEGLRRLSSLGLGLVIISNQSAVGRGYFDINQLEAIHQRMGKLLQEEGVQLSGVYWCPHRPDENCPCRKPAVGLGHRAAAELGFDLRECFVIGDKETDIVFGRGLGATTLLVRTGYGKEVEERGQHRADYIIDDLQQAASVITHHLGVDEGITRAVESV
jgi:D-glycero-alpha-D-manno-heptose 1-phosphate guanylyltransferase